MLAVFPQENTSLEYHTRFGEEKGSAEVYIHSAAARRPAEQAGAKIHLPASSALLQPGASADYHFCFVWARDAEDVRAARIRYGLMDVQVLPGMTAPAGKKTLLALRGADYCREMVQEKTKEAIRILRREFAAPDFLIWLTEQLAGRKN